ncbi:WhiB family transcriptional regulator [Streptomyces uncialis]|uniref:WhiB family transcriptional regulator n=1 Tax=Streptomyces uncialis TaxID=1048205 RepID=UPI0036474F4D
MSRYDWMAEAACTSTDPDLFFPERGTNYHDAQRICRTCPVADACATHAQALEGAAHKDSRHGAWGGHSPTKRWRNRPPATGNAEREATRTLVLRLHARGVRPDEIAAIARCSERTVHRIVRAARPT